MLATDKASCSQVNAKQNLHLLPTGIESSPDGKFIQQSVFHVQLRLQFGQTKLLLSGFFNLSFRPSDLIAAISANIPRKY